MKTSESVDAWLLNLEASMRATLQSHIAAALAQYPAELHPSIQSSPLVAVPSTTLVASFSQPTLSQVVTMPCFEVGGSWTEWFRKWEGQVVVAVSQIMWTAAVTKALSVTGN